MSEERSMKHEGRSTRGRAIGRLSVLDGVRLLIGVAWLLERGWKHRQVVRFFRQPAPAPPADPARTTVSIMQPILSGDPTLADGLAANLGARSRYHREWLWLVDDDDAAGIHNCRDLIARHPGHTIRLLLTPPPTTGDRRNPKLVKLIAGAAIAHGDILCVLDDDTLLPDDGLEACLPCLDQPGVGLAYGLPYYVSFADWWSSLVAAFVNSHSLLTYIPPLALTTPFTINGMFYAVRRDDLAAVGGFAGLEGMLADDFAVAQRFRAAGYRLVQTPLRHAISTRIAGPRHYLSLIRRWFIFPRESILRHVGRRDRLIVALLTIAPTGLPLLLLVATLIRPSRRAGAFAACCYAASFAVFAREDTTYLGGATPWRWRWLVPLVQTALPLQVAATLLLPQRIIWRGHVMEVERGGGFRFIQRRGDDAEESAVRPR
jgi:ceramide glucosyltransferase